MSTPFLGEIRIMSFNFAPKGWQLCDGQLLPINQNQALFSLLGTMYGGNGQTTFALPNLQGRTPTHVGVGEFSVQGAAFGETAHTLTTQELPQHNHLMIVSGTGAMLNATGRNPSGHSPAQAAAATNPVSGVNIWGTGAGGVAFAGNAITPTGGSQAHQNMQPYLTLNLCICMNGIFPSRN